MENKPEKNKMEKGIEKKEILILFNNKKKGFLKKNISTIFSVNHKRKINRKR